MRLDQPTLRAGERTWFLRRDGAGALEWRLLKAFDDGSALLRAVRGAETFPPPNGPRTAIERLATSGFHALDSDEGTALAGHNEPPPW
jgi:hypothetical protein